MRRILSCLMLWAAPVAAEPPHVVADIAPVHALVARVMEGVGEPELLVPAGVSAHDLALKPSQARALRRADLVVWVGPEMSPWLGRVLDDAEARDLSLLTVPGTQVYEARDDAIFDTDDDHDGHEGHDDHDGHDHDHDGVDPHAWLDPVNAAVWVGALAEVLSGLDPENAVTYHANADAAEAELAALTGQLAADLAPARGRGLIAFHDAFQYFEARFGLSVTGAIISADDSDPGPARLAALRDAVRDGRVACAFAEPQYNSGLLTAITEETGLPVAVLDPLGAELTVGPGLYVALLTQMGQAITACLDQAGKGE